MSDDTTKDKDPFRIAPELQEQIEADAMNEEAEYAFVEKMTPRSDNNDLIDVVFELPYGDKQFNRTFARDPVSQQYNVPSLEQLYELADGADRSDPKSILHTSIPIAVDEGYDVEVPPQQQEPKRIDTDAGESIEHIEFYPTDTTPLREYVVPSVLGLLGFVFGIGIGGIVGVLTVAIFLTVAATSHLQERAYKPPEGGRRVDNQNSIAANKGDVIVLDKTSVVLSKDQRAVVEVTGKQDELLIGEIPASGVTVEINPKTLDVNGPVGSERYSRAYLIDRSSGSIIQT